MISQIEIADNFENADYWYLKKKLSYPGMLNTLIEPTLF